MVASCLSVRACPGRLSALCIFHRKSVLYGAFVWARRALNGKKRRFWARAVMKEFMPQHMYTEVADMLRKLSLVGVLLFVEPGSIQQLSMAVAVSLGFVMMQMRSWPYKQRWDNITRATTELHLLMAIVAAIIFKFTNQRNYKYTDEYQNDDHEYFTYLLFIFFILLVPATAVTAVICKFRNASKYMRVQAALADGEYVIEYRFQSKRAQN
jgi:hypothetical protein